MASYAAARSVYRSCSRRSPAFRLASEVKDTRSPFRLTSTKSISRRTFRCSAPLSACLESMFPYHSVTASALMTSMLSISQRSYGWLPDVLDTKELLSNASPSTCIVLILCLAMFNILPSAIANLSS